MSTPFFPPGTNGSAIKSERQGNFQEREKTQTIELIFSFPKKMTESNTSAGQFRSETKLTKKTNSTKFKKNEPKGKLLSLNVILKYNIVNWKLFERCQSCSF